MNDALIKIEPVILDLESTIGIMTHVASGEVEIVSQEEWLKLANDLHKGVAEIKELWKSVWDEAKAEKVAHKAALAAARAEKAAPGSKEEAERAEALWTLLRSLVGVASEQCTNAGYPPRPTAAPGFREGAQQ
jgi:hypothetical protein